MPELDHMTGDAMADALVSGIHRVVSHQDLLNRINVFPVADSDTGTNLSLSLCSALPILQRDGEKHLGRTLAAIADALLDGARGNSGAIIAQFFQGMSDSAGDLTRFTTYTFGRAVRTGSDYAHDALSKPREGTILSIISAFADSISHQVTTVSDADFSAVLGEARKKLDEALADTPNQLDVLRKAGVVDAGAKGFVELVGGFYDHLIHGHITPLPDTAILDDIEAPLELSAADNASQYRFCTECLVTGTDIDRRKLREALTKLGDSMVLAGTKRKAKIHIHVDDPDAVFETARRFGEISGEKADDMHRQQTSSHNPSRKFAVITDSGADIGDEDMERLDIHMVPCRIQFGDRGYLDKVSITSDEFFAELKSNPHHPTTSQPAPGDFRRQFQFLARHFSDVLSINLTSRASGTFEGARSAASRNDAPGRIQVVDSLNASVGQGQLVVLAAECAAAGWSVDDTVRLIEQQIPRVRTFALLSDLRYAVRGGRLPGWVKTVADLLRLLPIISVKSDGRVSLAGFLFGYRNRVNKFARFVSARLKDTSNIKVSIGQALCSEDALQLRDALQSRIANIEPPDICELGSGLGVHGGPGTLLVSAQPAVSVGEIGGND